MKNLNLNITVSPNLFLKNPNSTDLGRSIISNSIVIIDQLGFESFTFKKLGQIINSPESSIYRYFENKHTLLIYLVSWYWSWIEYQLVFATVNINSSTEKLKNAIKILTQATKKDQSTSFINEVLLNKIIITESVKAFHTKGVENENKKGYFKSYKKVVERVSNLVLDVNPKFEYPHMLISTVIEGAHQQRFFTDHLPSLTDIIEGKDSITEFYTKMVFNIIK